MDGEEFWSRLNIYGFRVNLGRKLCRFAKDLTVLNSLQVYFHTATHWSVNSYWLAMRKHVCTGTPHSKFFPICNDQSDFQKKGCYSHLIGVRLATHRWTASNCLYYFSGYPFDYLGSREQPIAFGLTLEPVRMHASSWIYLTDMKTLGN